MFLHLSVSHFVHRGGCVSQHALGQNPSGRHPPGKHPRADTLQVDIPLASACWNTHIPLASACWDTPRLLGHCCGRYAYYWYAYLYLNCKPKVLKTKTFRLYIRVRSIAEKNKTVNPHSMLESFVNRVDARRQSEDISTSRLPCPVPPHFLQKQYLLTELYFHSEN